MATCMVRRGMDGLGYFLAYRPVRYVHYIAVVLSTGNPQIEGFSEQVGMPARYFSPNVSQLDSTEDKPRVHGRLIRG